MLLELNVKPGDSSESRPAGISRLAAHGPAPQLALAWERRRSSLTENAWAVLRGPSAPGKFTGAPFFRDCWISRRPPRGPLLASLGWHAAFLLLLLPLGRYVAAQPLVEQPRTELTWYGPARDFPLLLPAARRKPKFKPVPENAQPDRGSQAFHPRLTILNRPLRPNHPRQTLIQPDASPEPPKILPALPNIVEWGAPARPRPQINTALRQANPRAAAAQPEVVAPELSDAARPLDALNLAAPEADVRKPALPVSRIAAPRARSVQAADQAVPDAGALNALDSSERRLIALSAAPSPVAPPAEPLGNLSSRLSISPDVAKPGASGNSGPKIAEASGTGSGPAGLSITGGAIPPGLLPGSRTGVSGARLPAQPGVAAQPSVPAAASSRGAPVRVQPGSLAERIKLGASPESLLDGRVYSLNVNMPNLTSASGSWVLSFAELKPQDDSTERYTHPAADLTGPVPLHKVDPKYPSLLRSGHVEGEVLLYAVIRKDGSVDSIQLLAGIDPALDMNAMQALAQWKSRPGLRGGAPVDLEAIVHIPLHASAPEN